MNCRLNWNKNKRFIIYIPSFWDFIGYGFFYQIKGFSNDTVWEPLYHVIFNVVVSRWSLKYKSFCIIGNIVLMT